MSSSDAGPGHLCRGCFDFTKFLTPLYVQTGHLQVKLIEVDCLCCATHFCFVFVFFYFGAVVERSSSVLNSCECLAQGQRQFDWTQKCFFEAALEPLSTKLGLFEREHWILVTGSSSCVLYRAWNILLKYFWKWARQESIITTTFTTVCQNKYCGENWYVALQLTRVCCLLHCL